MAHYEIEIKTLLGSQENTDGLKSRMLLLDPSMTLTSTNKQLNHYFAGDNLKQLFSVTKHLFSDEQIAKFEKIILLATSSSVRTRQKDEEVLLVVKASVDEGTSENTVSRLEFEEPVALSLDELDQLVISAGYDYQAKWSREREEYSYKDINVCIDYNAGYGYLAEFEKIVSEESEVPAVRDNLLALMSELGVAELPQDRLARMFAHYNQNWPDYYGTKKTFTIE
jgi:predicted adenylyl cyclase CyaB